MMDQLMSYLSVFLCSMLPLLELRASLVLGFGLGLPWYGNLAVSLVGNLLPIPFILLFIRRILKWMKTVSFLHFDRIASWLEEKAAKKSSKVTKYALCGLFAFVAIPLPGTGAWMGALIASLLEMRIKHSLVSIALGVLVAGVLITVALYGSATLARFFFL